MSCALFSIVLHIFLISLTLSVFKTFSVAFLTAISAISYFVVLRVTFTAVQQACMMCLSVTCLILCFLSLSFSLLLWYCVFFSSPPLLLSGDKKALYSSRWFPVGQDVGTLRVWK